MKASHRLFPRTSPLPLSLRIYGGKRRRAAGKSFPEVTVVTGESQPGATLSTVTMIRLATEMTCGRTHRY